MVLRTNRAFLLLLLMIAVCGSSHAQATKSLLIRLLDSKTGHPIAPSGYIIRVDHQSTIHGDLVHQNEDGTGLLTIPAATTEVSIHASYDSSTEIYVNCDVDKHKELIGDLWYSVSEILTAGIVTPNGCGSQKNVAKIKLPDAKPGEIVFFVRPRNWKEAMN